jgi:enamidase
MAEQPTAAAGSDDKLVIKNIGLLLSGDLNRPVLEADSVVAVGGKIVAVGRFAEFDTSDVKTVIDAQGTVLAPGLIDSHVHPVAGTGRRGGTNWAGSTPLCMAASPR